MREELDHKVDFYYAMRHRDEELFHNEIQEAGMKNPNLKVYVRYSASGGSLTVEEIVRNASGSLSEYHVYMCGPYPMMQAFEKKFLESGVPAKNIHFEEFNLR